jgi:hypothetical protein
MTRFRASSGLAACRRNVEAITVSPLDLSSQRPVLRSAPGSAVLLPWGRGRRLPLDSCPAPSATGSRTPSQTAREAITCASPDGPVTIAAEALLALASWVDQRDKHGGNPCSPTNRPTSPPSSPRSALTAIWAQLPTDRRRRLQRLLAELLTRPVTVVAASPREGIHDHRTA